MVVSLRIDMGKTKNRGMVGSKDMGTMRKPEGSVGYNQGCDGDGEILLATAAVFELMANLLG